MPMGSEPEMERKFLEAYDENVNALFRHSLMRVRNREVAKDLVQETFARTWSYLAEGKDIVHMKAFLYRTLQNLIVDTSRKKRSVSLETLQEEDGFEPKDESHEADAETREEMKAAMRLLSSLDEMYASAISMRYIEGLSPGEIAKALAVSENVVSVRIHRGLKQLREIWRRNHNTYG